MKPLSSYARARMRAGLSQKEAAQRAGLAVNTLNVLERGKSTPRLSTLLRLAEIYGCGLDELTGSAASNSVE